MKWVLVILFWPGWGGVSDDSADIGGIISEFGFGRNGRFKFEV